MSALVRSKPNQAAHLSRVSWNTFEVERQDLSRKVTVRARISPRGFLNPPRIARANPSNAARVVVTDQLADSRIDKRENVRPGIVDLPPLCIVRTFQVRDLGALTNQSTSGNFCPQISRRPY